MTTLTKSEVCALLHISDSTLQRRMKAGVYQFTRGDGQFDPVQFSYAGIGLVEPTPAVADLVSLHGVKKPERIPDISEPDAFAPRPLTRAEMDEKFAADYLSGKATDSCGNGRNVKTCSLLGPVDVEPSVPGDPQAHMDPALLLGTNTGIRQPFESGEGFTRNGSPLAAGLSQQAYDDMMKDWTRRGGGRSEGEQEVASRRAVDNINRSFGTSPRVSRSTVR